MYYPPSGIYNDSYAKDLIIVRTRFQWTLLSLAVALVMAKRTNDAVGRYRRALELELDNAPRLVQLGTLLMDRRGEGDLTEVRRLIGQAHRLAPDRIEVRLARAELLALEGRRAEAAELYRAVAADLPEGSDYKRACELKAETLGH